MFVVLEHRLLEQDIADRNRNFSTLDCGGVVSDAHVTIEVIATISCWIAEPVNLRNFQHIYFAPRSSALIWLMNAVVIAEDAFASHKNDITNMALLLIYFIKVSIDSPLERSQNIGRRSPQSSAS